jgi:hypothetical protein
MRSGPCSKLAERKTLQFLLATAGGRPVTYSVVNTLRKALQQATRKYLNVDIEKIKGLAISAAHTHCTYICQDERTEMVTTTTLNKQSENAARKGKMWWKKQHLHGKLHKTGYFLITTITFSHVTRTRAPQG